MMNTTGIAGATIAVATLCARAGILCNRALLRKCPYPGTIFSLRAQLTADQVSLQVIHELLYDHDGQLARNVRSSEKWTNTFYVVFKACELTISLSVDILQKIIEASKVLPSQAIGSSECTWKEQEFKDLTEELRVQHSALRTLEKSLRFESTTTAERFLERQQSTFTQVKTKAESRFLEPQSWSPDDYSIDVFGIVDYKQADESFNVGNGTLNHDPYATVIEIETRYRQKPLLDLPTISLIENNLLDIEPDDQTPSRYLQELENAFSDKPGPDPTGEVDLLSGSELTEDDPEDLKRELVGSSKLQNLETHGHLEGPSVSLEPGTQNQHAGDQPGESPAGRLASNVSELSDQPTIQNHTASCAPSLSRLTSDTMTDPWYMYKSRLPPELLAELKNTAPLHYAAYMGDNKAIKKLMRPSIRVDGDGIDMNDHYRNRSPISFAVMAGHVETVIALLDDGPRLLSNEFEGLHACHWAVICSKEKVLKLLSGYANNAGHGTLTINFNDRNWIFKGWSLMAIAAYFGGEKMVRAVNSLPQSPQVPFRRLSKHFLPPQSGRSPLHSVAASIPYLLLTAVISEDSAYKSWRDSGYDPFWLCNQLTKGHTHELWSDAEVEDCKKDNSSERILMLNYLIKASYDIHKVDSFGFTTLQAACCGASEAVVKHLLKQTSAKEELGKEITFDRKRVKTKHILSGKSLMPNFGIEASPLHLAAFWNRAATIRMLVHNGADPNISGYARRTPLHYAAFMNNLEAVHALLSVGAKVDAGSCSGLSCPVYDTCNNEIMHTPLSLAVKRGHLESVMLLIKAEASVKDAIYDLPPDAQTSFRISCKETILHRAVRSTSDDSASIIEVLLENGADPNTRKTNGTTPLHDATIGKNKLSNVKMLLQWKANPKLRDSAGDTALHCAADRGSTTGTAHQVVEALLAHGADSTLSNNKAYTPLDLCRKVIKKIQSKKQEASWNTGHRLEDYEKMEKILTQAQATVRTRSKLIS